MKELHLSRRDLLKGAVVLGGGGALPWCWADEKKSPVMLRWGLEHDVREMSANLQADGAMPDLRFEEIAGRRGLTLDGAQQGLRFSTQEHLQRIGAGDFSCAAWVHHAVNDAQAVGDVLTKFDSEQRKGFHLSVVTNAGVTNGQSNLRQIQFGVDAGSEPLLQDCGRPGKAVYIFALISHHGKLFCATCEPGEKETGHVYRYAGEQTWIDCGGPDQCNAISAMAEYNGELYVGSAWYNLKGSSLDASPNLQPGGKVFRYLGDHQWEDCGRIGESKAVYGLIVYDGKLYASSLYAPAGVFRYEGGQKWTFCGTAPEGKRIEALTVFRGGLYGTGFDKGEIYRYVGGTEWKTVGALPETTQTYGFAIHGGELYVSTWPTAVVYRYVKEGEWAPCGRMGAELESMPLAHYNGALYTGTLPSGEVYRFDGGTTWKKVAGIDATQGVKYRRAWSMAVHQGKLFCGTLPSGKVTAISTGGCVTHDSPLPTGWQQVAAVRKGKELRLYLNGKRVGEQILNPKIAEGDFSSGAPFVIGAGNHSPWQGALSDIRLYSQALSDEEVAGVFRET